MSRLVIVQDRERSPNFILHFWVTYESEKRENVSTTTLHTDKGRTEECADRKECADRAELPFGDYLPFGLGSFAICISLLQM